MNFKVFVLAMTILAGISCGSKEETKTPLPQETPKPQLPQPQTPQPQTPQSQTPQPQAPHKHRLPPGHEKKLHGDKSARKYAPGHKH